MDAPFQETKQSGMPCEDQLVGILAQLDVKPTDELEMYCDGTAEVYDSGDNSEESNLPSPLPFFDRRINATASAPVVLQGVLSRARSSSPNRGACGAPRGRDIFQARTMTVSMPNLHSSRSTHNRGIGYSYLDNAADCGGNQGKHDLRSRIEEFDTLLEDL
uniref:Uncharacterized protein n=1 Tax=Cryptomonas curvata TaxID=233186 RepID=A0A7S0QZY8_9CRYP